MVETYTAGPLSGTSCVKRDCAYNASAIRAGWPENWVMHPYCTRAKELRDAGGNNLEDQWQRDIPGAADAKYVVDENGNTLADGAPIDTAFIPPAKFWEWLDQ